METTFPWDPNEIFKEPSVVGHAEIKPEFLLAMHGHMDRKPCGLPSCLQYVLDVIVTGITIRFCPWCVVGYRLLPDTTSVGQSGVPVLAQEVFWGNRRRLRSPPTRGQEEHDPWSIERLIGWWVTYLGTEVEENLCRSPVPPRNGASQIDENLFHGCKFENYHDGLEKSLSPLPLADLSW